MQGTTRWRPGLELVTSHFAILHDVTQFRFLLGRLGFRKLNAPYSQFVQVFFPFLFPFLYLSVTSLATSQKNLSFGLVW